MSDERSLSDALTESVDQTPVQNPETFDLGAFVGGVRPTRRGVRIYSRGDVLERMEELADQIENTPDGDEVDTMVDEYEDLRDTFQAGTWFVIEQRSREWADKFRKDARKDLGIPSKASPTHDQVLELAFRQIAAQCVKPAGVSADTVRAIHAANPLEADKLGVLVSEVNEIRAAESEVVTRDFSSRRSAPRATPRSSKH